MIIVYVALGGALGAVMRYWVVSAVGVFGVYHFPAGTLTVNVVGSLLMGLLIGVLQKTLPHSMELRAFLAVGVLGGFTTFSAFSLDVMTLWERGALLEAALYIVASVVGAIMAVFAGLYVSRVLV